MADYAVAISKGGDNLTITQEVLDALPDHVYKEIITQGLKTLLNRGMSKITKTTYPDDKPGLQKAAMEKAQANVADLQAGKIRVTGGKGKSKGKGAVMTEARRLAKIAVKDQMKAKSIKVSHVPASQITAAANYLIENDPTFLALAEENLAKRVQPAVEFDIGSIIHADPTLVAKAEAKKAKDKASKPLSAKQAGKTAPHKAKAKKQPQATA